MSLDVPVAFFIFNRPDPTRRVFAEIAKTQPRKLLVIADGPRTDAEWPRCQETRRLVEHIDWPCDVRHFFAESNLGCRRRMVTGIDWVFSQAEEAILLEDDCLPDPTFFPFCAELLERYRDNQRVFMISGDNMQHGRQWSQDSYYFSVVTHIWGWATWRRAWQHHDADLTDWPDSQKSDFPGDFVPSAPAVRFYKKLMADTFTGKLDAWSLGWMYAAWKQRALTVLPSVNLISNIGFGADATHTRKPDPFANLPISSMEFPLKHPAQVRYRPQPDMEFFKAAIKAA